MPEIRLWGVSCKQLLYIENVLKQYQRPKNNTKIHHHYQGTRADHQDRKRFSAAIRCQQLSYFSEMSNVGLGWSNWLLPTGCPRKKSLIKFFLHNFPTDVDYGPTFSWTVKHPWRPGHSLKKVAGRPLASDQVSGDKVCGWSVVHVRWEVIEEKFYQRLFSGTPRIISVKLLWNNTKVESIHKRIKVSSFEMMQMMK